MMKRRDAHARDSCEFLHVKRLRIVGFQPGDGSHRSVSEVAARRDGAEPCSLRRPEDAVDDFPQDQMTEERYVFGSIKKLHEPGARFQQAGGGAAHGYAALLRGYRG